MKHAPNTGAELEKGVFSVKKKCFKLSALMLALALLLSVFPAGAANAAPTPPSWWAKEDYLIFEDDPLYSSELWTRFLQARKEVENKTASFDGNTAFGKLDKLTASQASPAACCEMALLHMGRYLTGAEQTTSNAGRNFRLAQQDLAKDSPLRAQLALWEARCILLDGSLQRTDISAKSYRSTWLWTLYLAEQDYGFTLEKLLQHPIMDRVSQSARKDNAAQLEAYRPEGEAKLAKKHQEEEAERRRLKVFVDGVEVPHPDVKPSVLNGRTMVPVYQLAQALGARLSWDGATGTITLTRADTVVKMTIGSTTAYVNGAARTMDVAPTVLQNRTMIPAVFLAGFFGQKVEWDSANTSVLITEDKSVAGESNLEAWALPMAWHQRSNFTERFGGLRLPDLAVSVRENTLAKSWGVESREDLIQAVLTMTTDGHNADFLKSAALVNGLSSTEYRRLLASAQGADTYMLPYTKALSEKWGDRGILCWDLFRMSSLVQWGYAAGYLTYEEALVLLEPAARLLAEHFSSWDEANENCVDGYNWWARLNVLGKDTWETPRGAAYQNSRNANRALLDDSLFQTGVIPVPGLTIDDILATLK